MVNSYNSRRLFHVRLKIVADLTLFTITTKSVTRKPVATGKQGQRAEQKCGHCGREGVTVSEGRLRCRHCGNPRPTKRRRA